MNDLLELTALELTGLELESRSQEAISTFDQMKKFLQLQQLYNAAIKEVYTKLEILNDEYQVKFDYNPIHNIEYRLKSPKSIIGKLQKNNWPVTLESMRDNLFDIAGVRVICNYIDDIYRIEDFLGRQEDIEILRVRDYIKEPKENGYRSLHLIVEIPIFLSDCTELMPVEIQIRTIAMDFWASLEHHLKYKAKTEVSAKLRERLTLCAETISDLDEEMQSIQKEIQY